MKVVYDILFDAGRIFAYFLIVLSFIISALILFKPAMIVRFNNWLNTWFCTKVVGETLDTHVHTTETVLKYRWLIGTLFLVGSLYTIKYMFMDFNSSRFVSLVIKPSVSLIGVYEILFEFLKWLFIACSLTGVATCFIILFSPELYRKIGHKLDRVVSTEQIGLTLDTHNHAFDGWVIKHHIAVGLFMFLASCYLVVVFLFKYR